MTNNFQTFGCLMRMAVCRLNPHDAVVGIDKVDVTLWASTTMPDPGWAKAALARKKQKETRTRTMRADGKVGTCIWIDAHDCPPEAQKKANFVIFGAWIYGPRTLHGRWLLVVGR